MRSSFFEFHVAVSGLHTSRAALQTVSHNVANAATPGFSRQVALAQASRPLQLFNGRGMVGTGSHVFSVIQMRDVFLDRKYWGINPTLGEFATKRAQMSINEAVLSELAGENGLGLSGLFNQFFNTVSDLAGETGGGVFRTNVLASAESISTWMRDTHEIFLRQQRDVNNEIAATVAQINSIGSQIQVLNERIRVIEFTGDNANDLRDQRALLVDELSTLVNIEAYERDFGNGDRRFNVRINGQDFVSNLNLRTLTVRPRVVVDDNGHPHNLYRNPEDNNGLYDIFWGNGNNRFDIYHRNLSGVLRGLIDVRDGNGGNHGLINNPFAPTNDIPPLPRARFEGGNRLIIPASRLNRFDLSPNGGAIRFTDPQTGFSQEIMYSSLDIQPNGDFVFELIEPERGFPAGLDSFTTRITIGQTSNFRGIPYYINRLNTLVRTFVSAINFGTRLDGTEIPGVTGHVDGVNIHGERGDPPTLLFTFQRLVNGMMQDATSYNPAPGFEDLVLNNTLRSDGSRVNFNIFRLTANNFHVNPALFTNPDLLNGSIPGFDEDGNLIEAGPDHGPDNNLAILSWSNINTDRSVFSEGRLQDFIIGMTGELAVDIKQSRNFELNYISLTTQVNIQRMSIKNVSINEEMADMIKFNQLFQAASRLINVVDGIYDTLVNRLGLT